jgi:hypothetical protein
MVESYYRKKEEEPKAVGVLDAKITLGPTYSFSVHNAFDSFQRFGFNLGEASGGAYRVEAMAKGLEWKNNLDMVLTNFEGKEGVARGLTAALGNLVKA